MFTFERSSKKRRSIDPRLFDRYRILFTVPRRLVDEEFVNLEDNSRGKVYKIPSTRVMEYIHSNPDQFDLLLEVAIMEAEPGTFNYGSYELVNSSSHVLVQVLPVTKQSGNQLCLLPISLRIVEIDATDLGLFEE